MTEAHPNAGLNMGRHLTDEQWLTLMRLVPDSDTRAAITFPVKDGDPARVIVGGRRVLVHPDGREEDAP